MQMLIIQSYKTSIIVNVLVILVMQDGAKIITPHPPLVHWTARKLGFLYNLFRYGAALEGYNK